MKLELKYLKPYLDHELKLANPDWGAEKGKLYFVIKHGELKNVEL